MVPVPQTAEFSRVEPADVNYPVILNGQPTNLPAIHARGHFHFSGEDKVKKLYSDPSFLDEDGEAFVLDDPQNPMTLLWAMGPVFQVRVVSITYPVDKPQIEQQLAKQKKAIIYGIYFDFNQATIKKESQPVLKEIAEAMKNNPDWVLTVNGYTDNIGGDAYNLDLSKRRAAAVKKALVDQYAIEPTRLTTDGFGAASPVDTNETLEGRARNRRVELIRQ
jgi:outer membrane protein OmpA-like peptidoglycan-associated protein